jgi:hypothetical protein
METTIYQNKDNGSISDNNKNSVSTIVPVIMWREKQKYIQGVNKIMEKLRNRGIEFVLAALKKLQLTTFNVLPFGLHSAVSVTVN